MSETLTYQDAPQEELNEAEQEALEVGERMEQEQQGLLAGKYTSPEQLEKAYLELQQKLGSQEQQAEPEEEVEEEPESEPDPSEDEETRNKQESLTDADVDFLHNLAGGKKGYKAMLAWAKGALTKKEIQMYDGVMDRGDPNSIYFAVKSMVARYKEETGSDGKLLTGKASSSSGKVFRSQQELVAAMSDPRYDEDPAYRQDVMDQLERSDLQF